MVENLLIESQGPWSGPGCAHFVRDAAALAVEQTVRVVLIQDGVTAALPGAVAEMAELLDRGGQLWVDGFSLRQRACTIDHLIRASRPVGMDDVAAKLLEPAVRVVWH